MIGSKNSTRSGNSKNSSKSRTRSGSSRKTCDRLHYPTSLPEGRKQCYPPYLCRQSGLVKFSQASLPPAHCHLPHLAGVDTLLLMHLLLLLLLLLLLRMHLFLLLRVLLTQLLLLFLLLLLLLPLLMLLLLLLPLILFLFLLPGSCQDQSSPHPPTSDGVVDVAYNGIV